MAKKRVVDYEVMFLLSGWCAGYRDTLTTGVQAALTKGGYPEEHVEILRIRELEREIGITDRPPVDSSITSLSELYFTLPAAYQRPDILDALSEVYHQEVARLWESVQDRGCLSGAIELLPWRRERPQWVCEFQSYDTKAPEGPETNIHGQNTSQWMNKETGWTGHQGSIVFDRLCGRVRSHH